MTNCYKRYKVRSISAIFCGHNINTEMNNKKNNEQCYLILVMLCTNLCDIGVQCQKYVDWSLALLS